MNEHQRQGVERVVAEARRLAAAVDAATDSVQARAGAVEDLDGRLSQLQGGSGFVSLEAVRAVEAWVGELPPAADALGAARLADDAAALRRWLEGRL